MFVQKRIKIKKEFDTKEMAQGFAQGIEFAGNRDIRVKEFMSENNKFIVVLEKQERSKV